MSTTGVQKAAHRTGMGIPEIQKAAVRTGSGSTATAPITQIKVPQPQPHQILVKITWSGLCATDNSILHDDFSGYGIAIHDAAAGIVGHEGAGIVLAVGSEVKGLWKEGDRAGVKWVVSVCGKCEMCTNGVDEVHCPSQLNSGFTTPGTFQEYCVTDGRYASHLPDGVLDEEAGPIMCGGVTAYVACKRSAVKPGKWLVILGAGGGLGHFGVQYAKAMGMRVIAVDGGKEKEELCLKLGAENYVDFAQEGADVGKSVMEITTWGAHGVIVMSASRAGYESAPLMLRPGGTMVAVGIPSDPTVVAGASPVVIAMRKLNVVGSVTGTLKDVEEALDFTARGLVHPILTKGTLADVDKYCDMLKYGKMVGRAVLKIGA